ncbi:MAG TPA: hypothetical protein VF753_16750 [Terriglobales bacterium]
MKQAIKIRIQPRRADYATFIPQSMKTDERERMYKLCAMIEVEQDQDRFIDLIRELNELLALKERRLDDKAKS